MCLEVEIYMLRLHLHIFFLCLLMALSCQRYPDPYTEGVPAFVSIESHVQGSSVVMTAVLEKALPNKFECGFYYGLKGTAQKKVEAQLQGNRVTLEQSGLMSASNYTFKAYITNGRNERCSQESTFSTDPDEPPVDPDDPSTNPDEPEIPPTDDPEAPPVDPDDPSTNPDEPETPPTDDPVTPPVVDPEEPTVELIDFADEGMKNACVAAFDIDHDGELSTAEASAVKDLSKLDLNGVYAASFDEFKYFTSVESIPPAFFKNQLLVSITFPASLKTISSEAFEDCLGLTHIEIPSGVTEIGSWAFCGCSNIRTVSLPQPEGALITMKRGFVFLSILSPVDQGEEFAAHLFVRTESAEHGGRDHFRILFFNTAHHHAKMLTFENDSHAFRIHALHYRFGDLFCKFFLNLQSSCETVNYTRKFRNPKNLPARNVTDRASSVKRKHVILAHRINLNVAKNDHVIRARFKNRVVYDLAGSLPISSGEERQRFRNALRRFQKAFAIRIFSKLYKQLPYQRGYFLFIRFFGRIFLFHFHISPSNHLTRVSS